MVLNIIVKTFEANIEYMVNKKKNHKTKSKNFRKKVIFWFNDQYYSIKNFIKTSDLSNMWKKLCKYLNSTNIGNVKILNYKKRLVDRHDIFF